MEAAFIITPNAATHIQKILETEAQGSRFRISVQGGGCSGFQYNFLIDTQLTDDDKIFTQKTIPDRFQDLGKRSSVEDRSVQIVHEDRRCDDQRTQDLKDEGYIEVVLDFISLGLLNGSHLDYVEDLTGAKFVIKNPNAASACGCGNSFSI